MDCGFIEDGYTRPGYVSAVEGLHPACRFTFRPVLAKDRAILCNEIERRNDPAWAEAAACDLLEKQLFTWDLKRPSGELVEITTENLRRVVPALHGKLYAIVIGFRPSEVESDYVIIRDGDLVDRRRKIKPEEREREEEKNFSAG